VALDKTVKMVLLFYVSYMVFFPICCIAIYTPPKNSYQRFFGELEAGLPMPAITRSFQSYTTPPWLVSDKPVSNRAEFLGMAYGGDVVAIYKEKDYWGRGMIYYVVISPTEYSCYLLVYVYRPTVNEIDNGFFKPRAYEIF
jgi:hypothetical protein